MALGRRGIRLVSVRFYPRFAGIRVQEARGLA